MCIRDRPKLAIGGVDLTGRFTVPGPALGMAGVALGQGQRGPGDTGTHRIQIHRDVRHPPLHVLHLGEHLAVTTNHAIDLFGKRLGLSLIHI